MYSGPCLDIIVPESYQTGIFFLGGGGGAVNYLDIVHLLKGSLEIHFDLTIYKDIMI